MNQEKKIIEDIKEFTNNNLNELNNDVINVLCTMINQIKNYDQKKEVIELTVKKIKKLILDNPEKYSEEEIKDFINIFKNNFTVDELNTIIYPLNFTYEDIKKEMDLDEDIEEELDLDEEKEITKIRKRIKELNEKQSAVLTIDNKKLLTKKDIEDKIKDLKEEQRKLWNLAENGIELTEQEHERFHKIDEIIKNLSKELNNEFYGIDTKSLEDKLKQIKDYDLIKLNNEEINKQIQKLNDEYDKLWIESTHGVGLSEEDKKRVKEIFQQIEHLKNIKTYKDYFEDDEIDKQIQKLIEENKELWIESVHGVGLSEEDQKRIEEIPRLIQQLKNEKKNSRNNKANQIKKEIEKLEKEIAELYREDVHGVGLSEEDQKKYEQSIKKINELKKLLDVYNIIVIEEEINKRKNNLNPEEKNELQLLEKIEKAYTTIIRDAEKEFKDKLEEDNIKDKITEYVNSHPMMEAIEKYNNADKLKKELLEDVFKKLKIKEEKNKITKKGNKKDLLYKALAACAGFVTGLGLSCVPGVGTIRMAIAGTKLATNIVKSSVNIWTKKHPGGRIDKLKTSFADKISKFNNYMEEKHPKINSGINKMKQTLKNPKVNCFINGVAVGYIAGNVFEFVTGETILEKITDPTPKPTTTFDVVNRTDTQKITDGNATPGNVPTATPTATGGINPSNIESYLANAETNSFDLSGIEQGYVSSSGINPVDLLTASGDELTFDRIVTNSNGEKMVHFFNGEKGYAWFKLDDVIEELSKNGAKVGKIR